MPTESKNIKNENTTLADIIIEDDILFGEAATTKETAVAKAPFFKDLLKELLSKTSITLEEINQFNLSTNEFEAIMYLASLKNLGTNQKSKISEIKDFNNNEGPKSILWQHLDNIKDVLANFDILSFYLNSTNGADKEQNLYLLDTLRKVLNYGLTTFNNSELTQKNILDLIRDVQLGKNGEINDDLVELVNQLVSEMLKDTEYSDILMPNESEQTRIDSFTSLNYNISEDDTIFEFNEPSPVQNSSGTIDVSIPEEDFIALEENGYNFLISNSHGNVDIENGDLIFNSEVTSSNLWMKNVDGDLIINVLGTDEEIVVQNWFNGEHSIEKILTADGVEISSDQIENFVEQMSQFNTPENQSEIPPQINQMWESL